PDVGQGREQARRERTRAGVDLDDAIDARGARGGLEAAGLGAERVELFGGRAAGARRVPAAELAETLARQSDVGRQESIVHEGSLCTRARVGKPVRSLCPRRHQEAATFWPARNPMVSAMWHWNAWRASSSFWIPVARP